MNAVQKPRSTYDKLFINGQWTSASGGREDVINPANEAVVGHVPLGTVEDAERAIAAARSAFDNSSWPDEDRDVRAGKMQRLYERALQRREEILAVMQLEIGFTRIQCEVSYGLVMTQVKKFIEVARKDPMQSLPIVLTPQADGTTKFGGAIRTRDPIGVVAAITPYNAGYFCGLMKIVPALGAGNTVVLKPSPYTPLQTMIIAELVAELDLPQGVFNIVTGGAEVGQMLASDPRIDMITFTGSDAVGSKVMASAAATIKKVHLELGGKSPLIVRHDADLELAVKAGMWSFFLAGQGCSLMTRHLVDNRIRPAFVEGLARMASGMKVGDPAQPDTGMGPLIRDVARTRTEDFCSRALQEGARLVIGGRRPAGLDKGYFFEATIFDDVRNDSHLGQKEVFGPIAAVVGFDDDAQAVRLANQSEFGLGGAIVSRDAGTAMKMALKMRTGSIHLNFGCGGFHPDTPFGGYKRSGLGREWGEEGFNEYTEIKAIEFPCG